VSKRKDNPDSLLERLVKVETKLDQMEKSFDHKFTDVFDRLKTLDNRLWYLLAGIVLSILLALLQFARP